MQSYLRQSTAAQSRALGPFIDSSDFVTPATGLTIANTDIKLVANGAASANKNSGGGTHRVNGVYGVTFDATDTATVGELEVSVVVSGALPVFTTFVVLPAQAYDELHTDGTTVVKQLKQLSIVNSAGSAIVASATGSNGHGIAASGNGTGAGLSGVGGATGHGFRAIGGATSGHGLLAEAGADGNGIYAHGLESGDGLAAEGWQGITGMAVGGPAGQPGAGMQLQGIDAGAGLQCDGGVTGNGLAAGAGATSGHGAAFAAAGVGNGFLVSAAGGSPGMLVEGQIGLLIESNAGDTPGMLVSKSGTGVDIDANILGNITGDLSGSVGSVTGNVGGNLVGDVQGNVDGSVDSVTQGVSVAVGGIDATAFAAGAVDAAALATDAVTEISNGVATRAYDGAVTLEQSIRLQNSAAGAKLSGAATTTVAIRDLADSKDRVTATVDADGNRTAVVRDLT